MAGTRKGMSPRWGPAIALALVAMVALDAPPACWASSGAPHDVGPDGGDGGGGRTLSILSFGLDLAQRLAGAITSGDIDAAAGFLIDAVRLGDSDSLLQGLFLSKSGPGIAQTIIRAFGLGLDSDELQHAVENGSGENEEAAGFVERVMALVTGILKPDRYGDHSAPVGQAAAVPAHPEQVPLSDQPPPPPVVTRTFVNGEEVRECRGKKEEKCCSEFHQGLPGCLCVLGDCRFQFIRFEEPIVIMDTRRADNRACTCP